MSASPPPSTSAAPVNTQSELYGQIFGGDDDDLSDDEDFQPKRQQVAFPPRPTAPPTGLDQDRDEGEEDEDEDEQDAAAQEALIEDDDDDDDDDGGVYVPATATAPAKIPKFKKKHRDEAAGDEEDGDEEVQRKKRKEKKEKRRKEKENRATVAEEEEEDVAPVYDEATQRRMALEERIDNIGKKAKVVRRKKRGEDVDILDEYHETICIRLRDRMLAAAEKDKKANDAKLPATAKLGMLDEVMGVLRNQTLSQAIGDNQVLDAVRVWLEPIYPSGALPAVGIQKAIFEVLPKMDLDTQILKECRLGPIVLFYTKTKRVTPVINRQADALVQAWSRPIIKRPANMREKDIPTARGAPQGEREGVDGEGEGDEEDEDMETIERRPAPKRERFDVRAALKENEGRRGMRHLVASQREYKIAPEANLAQRPGDARRISKIQADNRKFNRFARQIKASKKR